MKISLHAFCLALRGPLSAGGKSVAERKGFLVRIADEDGKEGWGEAAPLPGLDKEALEECRQGLLWAARHLASRKAPETADLCAPFFGAHPAPPDLPPVAAFGVESALLWLRAVRGKLAAPAFGRWAAEGLSVPVNGLFAPPESDEESARRMRELSDAGFTTVKVKIGRHDPELEIRRVRELWSFFRGRIVLRLDANRSLTPALYRRFFDALRDMAVEYVEEPLQESFGFVEAGAVPWPPALDESLGAFLDPRKPDPARLPQGLAAAILKPGSFPGVAGLLRAARALKAKGTKVVFSSSFNTGVGVATLGLLAALAGCESAQGLDTLKYLDGDVLACPVPIAKGFLTIPAAFFSAGLPVDLAALREAGA
ncbi:MAG: enolase C-terminal domain-like protein [Thermodesulfobacteriota bacterium]